MRDWEQEGILLRSKGEDSYKYIGSVLKKKYNLPETEQQVGEHIRYLIRKDMTASSDTSSTNRKTYSSKDIKKYYEAVKLLSKASENLDTKQTNAAVDIDEDKPILLIFWGDWHVGAKGVNYEQLDADIELIANTDGVYSFGLGDYKDNANAMVIPASTNEDTIPSGMQDLIVKDMMKKLEGKMQVIVRGCHDDWDYKVGNKDFVQTLCDDVNAVNLWHGGYVRLSVGNEEYKLYIRHKWKNESGLNTTNAQRNVLNDKGHVDIVAVAHKHYPDMQTLYRMGGQVIYIRTGSYKEYDEYGQKIGGYSGTYGIPCVAVYPFEHKMIPFFTLEDGINFINKERV